MEISILSPEYDEYKDPYMCSMRINLRVITIVLMIGFASACVTMQPLKGNLSKEEIANTIRGGDQVTIVTKTGEQYLDKFSYVTEDKIIGYEKEFQLEDIERIEIRQLTVVGKATVVFVKAGDAVVAIGEALSFIALIILIVIVI